MLGNLNSNIPSLFVGCSLKLCNNTNCSRVLPLMCLTPCKPVLLWFSLDQVTSLLGSYACCNLCSLLWKLFWEYTRLSTDSSQTSFSSGLFFFSQLSHVSLGCFLGFVLYLVVLQLTSQETKSHIVGKWMWWPNPVYEHPTNGQGRKVVF